jgi:hypothetical protein
MADRGATLRLVVDERLALLSQVVELVATATRLDLQESVFLLNMVQLDLRTKIHKIDDGELQAFMKVVRSSVDRP